MDREYARGWLRGFFDGEGGAYLSRYGKKRHMTYSVGGFGTSKELMDKATEYLDLLDVPYKLYHTKNRGTKSGMVYQLKIQTKIGLARFADEIGFTETRKRDKMAAILAWINRPEARNYYGRDALGRFTKR